MKLVDVKLALFEKGDYVRTPDGVGIVEKTDITIGRNGGIEYYEVLVQHKFGCSSNTSNHPQEIDGFTMGCPITKEEYDSEEEWY